MTYTTTTGIARTVVRVFPPVNVNEPHTHHFTDVDHFGQPTGFFAYFGPCSACPDGLCDEVGEWFVVGGDDVTESGLSM
jgi:hypothetical protein